MTAFTQKALLVLAGAGGDVSCGGFARIMGWSTKMAGPRACGHLERLAAMGYAQRRHDAHNSDSGFTVCFSLTKKGWEAVKELSPAG